MGVRRDLSAGNERPGEDKGGKRMQWCVELDISVSCQRLVHGCGMLMSEVSLGSFPSLSFSTPTFSSLVRPPSSFPRSSLEGEK